MENVTPYRYKRYYVFGLITLIAFITPFIRIGENHLFLLSFDKGQFHLMGTAFNMNELYVMPFVLMLLFIGIFAATALGGRVFCGWGCPQTIFRVIYRDFIETTILGLRKRIKNKQKDPDYSKSGNQLKRLIGILMWSVLAFVAAANFIWFFVPPEDFFNYIQSPMEHRVMSGTLLGIAIFLIYDVIFLKEDWCIYICPYSRIQSVLYDENTLQAIYNPHRGGKIYDGKKEKLVFKQKDLPEEQNECTTCESCVTVCPTHIDIRKGLQLECINCLECVDACTTVMGKLGKPSLVQWSSQSETDTKEPTKFLRTTTYMYIGALIVIFAMLFIMGGQKEYMSLSINKESRLYKLKADHEVQNSYLMLFQNTEHKKHTYKLEVVGEYADNIKIKRFDEVTLRGGKGAKDVLILSTKDELVHNEINDTPLKVMLKAYAVDEPKRVVLFKEVVFFYPQSTKLK